MTTDNLPVVRTSTALAVPDKPTRPATTPEATALRLSTALCISAPAPAIVAAVAANADRIGLAATVGAGSLTLLTAALVERIREHRT